MTLDARNHWGAMNRSDAGTFRIMHWGAVYASVCTSLSPDEATVRLNAELPTGIESQWKQAPDPTFVTGEPNPFPCPDERGCAHFLFRC